MTDQSFFLVWFLSFGIYLIIYTWWIPIRTRQNIEAWLMSEESDSTLLASLSVITGKIREQTLIDFEEFMLPQARENLQKFWAGAMGNAAQKMKNSEEGSQLSLLHSMTKELDNQPWYIQMAASKLMPLIADAAGGQTKGPRTPSAPKRMGLS
tara:strand:+ start:689 stop:1147 length:459 start_codon:yes stop_codon:yes gene_type:complete